MDKDAPYDILSLSVQFWHSKSQSDNLLMYKIATVIVFAITLLVLFGETAVETFMYIFVNGNVQS